MALTAEQKQELQEVLKRTGAHREAGKAEKVVPDSYRAYQELVDRETVTVEVPSAGVPVTCYITRAKDRTDSCPVHINMHGGGFVFLQDEDDDLYCAHVAARIRGIVVDVDYASSLDHPYPTAFEQCLQVVRWVFDRCREWGADEKKVSVGGHSAGGELAAAISLKAAQTGEFRLCLQVMDYAATDNYSVMEQEGAERSRAFSMLYADGEKELLKDPFVSPAFAPEEMLKDQPRTLIINGQNCPFCQINEEYGQKLIRMGNEVVMRRFLNSRHGFTVRLVDEWREAQELIIREIQAATL